MQAESSQDHLRKFIAEVNSKFSEVTSNEQKSDDGQQDDVEELLGKTQETMAQAPKNSTKKTQQLLIKPNVTADKHGKHEVVNVKVVKLVKPAVVATSKVDVIIGKDMKKKVVAATSTSWIKQEMQISEEPDQQPELMEEDDEDEEILDDSQPFEDEESIPSEDPTMINEEEDDALLMPQRKTNASADEDMQEEHLEIEHFDFETTSPPVKRPRRKPGAAGDCKENDAHICQECNKDFSTRTNLLRHMNTHNGVKPYRCTVCDKGFTQNASLKQHMHIHTGERPYQCEFCNRGFTQPKSLVFHMRRHTGEKPFKCDVCQLAFRQKDGLKRHRAVRHTTEPKSAWSCDTCGKVRYEKNMR